MANEMTDEGLTKAGQMWLRVAEEKMELVNNDMNKELLDDVKAEVSLNKIIEDTFELSKNLCKKSITTVHEYNFKSSTISCRLVQEGGIPFSLRKFEELSMEPAVYLIHDFLSKKEADDFLKSFNYYEYNPFSLNSKLAVDFFPTYKEEKGPVGDLLTIFRER